MILLIGGILLILGGIGALVIAEGGGKFLGGVALVLGVGAIIASSTYTQDVGEAKVLKSFDGTVVGEDLTPGFGNKAPWVSAENFNIRSQQAIHSKFGEDNAGTFITTQDKNGVNGEYDVAVRYSIRPEKVVDIYTEYKSQEEFEARLIDQDIRSVVRAVPNAYTTIQVLTKRGEIETGILESLKTRWEKEGVLVESVALQEIRYPEEVKKRFEDAQNASTEQERAKVELETTKITSEKKVVEAESEREANRILGESLTPEILEQRRLDTLKAIGEKGNLIVVPEGSTPFVQVDKK